jgi:acetyl/propionyl-CoA carboxylase alpha subunit
MRVDTDLDPELADLSANELTEIEVEDGERKIKVRREAASFVAARRFQAARPLPLAPAAGCSAAVRGSRRQCRQVADGRHRLSCRPSRAGRRSIAVGKAVKPGDTLLIVEAMKVMNPITAPVGRHVKQIMVDDGQPVEFDSRSSSSAKPWRYRKLLIANRGEIALASTAPATKWASDGRGAFDRRHRRHARRLADETVCIGPPPASESYLNIANIISAAEIVHADAIHPATASCPKTPSSPRIVESHGIVWGRAQARAYPHQGDKIEAKRTAAKLGLPLVPGSDGRWSAPIRRRNWRRKSAILS